MSNMDLLCDPATLPIGIYPWEMKFVFMYLYQLYSYLPKMYTSKSEWINQGWYIHTVEYYLAIKKNELLICTPLDFLFLGKSLQGPPSQLQFSLVFLSVHKCRPWITLQCLPGDSLWFSFIWYALLNSFLFFVYSHFSEAPLHLILYCPIIL